MALPNIEGTYQFVRRELPDGTVQGPPDVKGMMTLTSQFRNFSVVWKDDQDRFYSECYVAQYELTEKEYRETSDYLIINDEIGGKGITYDLSSNTVSAPVSVEDGRVRFAMPHPFEQALSVVVELDGEELKATGDGFVDYWVKVT